MQATQQQLVHDYDKKLAAAAEAERAIRRALTTQVESLQRQVASLTSLQAENEALKAAAEVLALPPPLACVIIMCTPAQVLDLICPRCKPANDCKVGKQQPSKQLNR